MRGEGFDARSRPRVPESRSTGAAQIHARDNARRQRVSCARNLPKSVAASTRYTLSIPPRCAEYRCAIDIAGATSIQPPTRRAHAQPERKF
jgi:hypothetical protein